MRTFRSRSDGTHYPIFDHKPRDRVSVNDRIDPWGKRRAGLSLQENNQNGLLLSVKKDHYLEYRGSAQGKDVVVYGGASYAYGGIREGAMVVVNLDGKEMFSASFKKRENDVAFLFIKTIADDISRNGLNSTFLKRKQ